MPLQKARANLALDTYCARLQELFSGEDRCVTALYIDVIMEYYGYCTTIYDEEGKEVRRADFIFPYGRHGDPDLMLSGVQSDLFTPDAMDPAPIELYSKFPNDEPSEVLVRRIASAHADYAFFYLTDGWKGPRFALDRLIPVLKFVQQEKEEGVEWLKFKRVEEEIDSNQEDQPQEA